MKQTDIFISYRREGGNIAASSLYGRLKNDGYKAFLDVSSMGRCNFDTELQQMILSCKDFVLIISKDAFANINNPNDWYRREIECAIRHKKNIIPIFLPDFGGFPKDLPDEIASIRTINGINYSHEHSVYIYKNLKRKFLKSKGRMLRIVHILAIFSLITLALIGYLILREKPLLEEGVRCAFKATESGMDVCLARSTFRDTLRFIRVEGGAFRMGTESYGGADDEKPAHLVELDTYWIMDTELTEGEWHLLTGMTDNAGRSSKYPRIGLNYDICEQLIEELNIASQDTRPEQLVFRFPTEAEWEYAARGGRNQDPYTYSGSQVLGDVTNTVTEGKTCRTRDGEVKQYAANSLGIYDMSGGVFEWCFDWYAIDYYQVCSIQGTVKNPVGPKEGSIKNRIIRGGSYDNTARSCEVTNRSSLSPSRERNKKEYDKCGLRLVIGSPL